MEIIGLVYTLLATMSLILLVIDMFRKTSGAFFISTTWIMWIFLGGVMITNHIGFLAIIGTAAALWASWHDFKVFRNWLENKDQLQTDAD